MARVRFLEQQLEMERSHSAQLENDKRMLRQAMVALQLHAEQDEENISNTLLRKISKLELEKERLESAGHNTDQLRLELEQLRKDKVDIENKLEQESEFVVNRLAREKEKLEHRNSELTRQLHTVLPTAKRISSTERPSSASSSASASSTAGAVGTLTAGVGGGALSSSSISSSGKPSPHHSHSNSGSYNMDALKASQHLVGELSREVLRLRRLLVLSGQAENDDGIRVLEEHEALKEENLRLTRKLRHALERIAHLERASVKAESDIEMDEERLFNLRRSRESSVQSSACPSPVPAHYASPHRPAGSPLSAPSPHGQAQPPPQWRLDPRMIGNRVRTCSESSNASSVKDSS